MRATIVALFVTLTLSTTVAAEWDKVGDTNNGAVYADLASIRRTGDIVKMIALYDLKSAVLNKTTGSRYVSQKLQAEFDCKEDQWRTLGFSWYSGSMGEGSMVEDLADAFKWETVPSGSGLAILRQLACGKH